MDRSWHRRPLVFLPLLFVLISAPASLAQEPGRPANASASERALIAQLSSPGLQAQRDAARKLAAIEPMPPEVIRALANFLRTAEQNDASQRYAIIGLARAGAPALVPVAGLLSSHNPAARGAAREILGRMASKVPATWPILIADFKREPLGPWYVAYELARAGPPVVPPLRQALTASDPRTRMGAAATLAEMASFARINKSASPRSRRYSGIALATDRDLKPAAPELARALNDPDPGVRTWAAVALAYADRTDTRSIPILVSLLSKQNFVVRDAAISAIQHMGGAAKPAAPALERALASSPYVDVRLGAARALPLAGGQETCLPLARAVATDKAANVRVWAARSLVAIHPQCPQALAVLLGNLGSRQYSAIDELAKIGAPAVPGLLRALKDPNLYVRQDSVATLAAMKPMPPEAKHALMVALSDRSLDVRSAADRALLDAGGAAQRAAEAEQTREEKIYAQEAKPDTRRYTRRQILAPIPADPDRVYPLTLRYLVPVIASGEPLTRAQFVIALYSGKDRPERLIFWKKLGRDAYRKAKVFESENPALGEQHYEIPDVFTAKVHVAGRGTTQEQSELFVDVPVDGWRSHTDQLFAVAGNKLHPVKIQSARKRYQPRLGPRESIQYPASNSFSDNELDFWMPIWNADDPMCCPSAGGVAGTYRIVEEAAAGGAKPTWKMTVASARREMPKPRPRLPKKAHKDKLAIWLREADRGSPPSLSQLLAALKSSDMRDRNAAAMMLDRVNPLPPKAIRALAEALKTPDAHGQFQFSAFRALSLGGASAIPTLALFAQSGDAQACRFALQALGYIGLREPAAWPPLIKALRSASAETAESALAGIGDPVVPLLRKSLTNPDPRLRVGAAAALAQMANSSRIVGAEPSVFWPPAERIASPSDMKAAKPELTALLSDPVPSVRAQAAIALASVDPSDKRAIPALIAIIGARNPKLRATAFTTLQLMGKAAKEAAPPITRALERSPDPRVRAQAARVLAAIGGAPACPTLARAAAHDKSDEVRVAAMRAMALESPVCPQAFPALIGSLGQHHGIGRISSWFSLAKLGKPAVAPLAEALKSPDLSKRQDAVRALALMDPLTPQAVKALMVALEDKNLDVRSCAAKGLQNAKGEAKRAGAAELRREQLARARQNLAERPKLNPRHYSESEMIAPIPPDAHHAHPLTLAYLFPLYRFGSSAKARFLVTLHSGTGRLDRLAFWQKIGSDQYQLLKTIELHDRDAAGEYFETPRFFEAKVNSSYGYWYPFVDVPLDGPQGRRDRVFVFDWDRVRPVQIESPETWFESNLGANESMRAPVTNSFTSAGLKFRFAIWKASDSDCCPTAEWVVGSYKVELRRPGSAGGLRFGLVIPGSHPIARGMSLPRPPGPAWSMVVASAKRKPARSR